jgi:hypothetical protein
LVTPDTVVRWHRAGFRVYWAWLSRTRHIGGRRPLTKEPRELIFRTGCGVSAFEWAQRYFSAATRWAASPLYGRRPNNFQLRAKLLRCHDRREIHAWILAARALPPRFWDAHSGRRPPHAKRCCPRKGPPASKTRRRLVLMNHSSDDERSGSFISSRLLRCPILELHEAMHKQTRGEALLRYTSLVNSA